MAPLTLTGFFWPIQAGEPVRRLIEDLLGRVLAGSVASFLTDVIWWVLLAVLIYGVVQIAMLYGTWLERKFIGRIQDRIGPNRVGPFGLLQPIADMVKMLTKEDITPSASHRWVYNLGAILAVPPTILVFAVIPASRDLIASNLSVGFLFFIAVASTAVVSIFMSGWGSNNKYALLGAMRAVAQIVSYEIPQVLSVVGVLLMAGTLSTNKLIEMQGPGGFPGVWFAFVQPVGFIIFVLATTAEIERTPFDLPEAESEIIAGYHVEYSGLKFGLFYLALYFATIAASALTAVLFLGGWHPPLAALEGVPVLGSGILWMTVKTLAMVLLFMWLRGTLPRLRVDQLMAFAWKVLVPLALLNLLVAGLVGKLAFNAGLSPLFTFLGFSLANVIMIALTLGLVAWWRGQQDEKGLSFDKPATVEGPA